MINYIIYRLGQFIVFHVPLKIGYKIAVFLSDLHYIFANKDRQRVKGNLKVIFPEKSDREINRIRIRMFRNFAKYLVDFFRFSKIDAQYIKRNIKIENIHYVDQALSKGKGVIALSAHIGNWELGGVVVAQSGYDFWEVTLPHKHKRVDDFFNRQREIKKIKVIPFGRAARQCLNVLNKNGVLALLSDRDFSEKGMVLDFFGKPTFFPEGPAAFSLKTGASIVPAFMLRNKDDTFTLRFEKPLEFTPTNNKEEDFREIIKQCKTMLEDYIRRYPDQWYMFRRFWIEEK